MTKPFEGITTPIRRHHDDAPPAPAFVHPIRVGWGDCDPATIAYTARIPEWALSALEAWWQHQVGAGWYELHMDRGYGTPYVHMKMDFRSPITPRHLLDCEVVLTRLGHRSIAHQVRGRQNGVLCFESEFVAVFVDTKTMKPHTPPADILERLRAALPDAG